MSIYRNKGRVTSASVTTGEVSTGTPYTTGQGMKKVVTLMTP